MPKFKLKKGKKHYWKCSLDRKKPSTVFANRQLEEEAIVECEENELGGARDKFDLVVEVEKKQEPNYGFFKRKIADGEYEVISEKTGEKVHDGTIPYDEACKLLKGNND